MGETFSKLKQYPSLACWTTIDYCMGWVTGDMVGDEHMIARCSSIARAAKPRLHPVTVPAGNLRRSNFNKKTHGNGKGLPSWSFFHTDRNLENLQGVSLGPGVPYALTVSNIKVRGGHLGRDILIFEEDVMNVYKFYMYIHRHAHVYSNLQNMNHFAKDFCRWLIQLPRKLVWIPQIDWPFKRGEESL